MLGAPGWAAVLGALAVVAVLAPVLNLLVPADSAFHLSDYAVALVGKIMCYAICALAMDLIWGYTGILSLGHGLFFALGGYGMGMYLMRQIGREGSYKSDLPDFMVFLDWKEAPWHWALSESFIGQMMLVLLVPALLAFVFGFFAFRSRIKGVYFSIITQAMTFAAMLLLFRNETGFGGNNGFTDFKRILDIPLMQPSTRMVLFVLTGLTLIGFFLMARWLVNTKFGRVLQAIRDAESRVMFCGYNPLAYKLAIWTLSAMMCAIAGALYVPQVGIINPSEMSPAASIEIAIWAAVGGASDPGRADRRGLFRQRCQELVHRGLPGVLALLPGPAVCAGDAVPAPRHRGPVAQESGGEGMTPDLMTEGSETRRRAVGMPKHAGESGGREASYGRVLTDRDEVDLAHGSILYLDDIEVSFDGFKALNKLSLDISVGEMRCIIGPNGAGKTTMMDVITGKTRPDSGTAFFGTTIDLLKRRENDIAQIGIGRKFQKPTVFEQLSVFENLELALKADRRARAALFFRLSGEQLDRIGAMLDLIHLNDEARRTAGLLSHGQKQWLEIGMLLMQDPKLLLLDEPVAGMTDEETERTAELFLSLEGAHSLVVVEHDMKFIHELTTQGPTAGKKKVTVLHEGSVLAEGSLAEVQANEQVVEVYLGR